MTAGRRGADDPYAYACPACGAKPDRFCKKENGQRQRSPHMARVVLADRRRANA